VGTDKVVRGGANWKVEVEGIQAPGPFWGGRIILQNAQGKRTKPKLKDEVANERRKKKQNGKMSIRRTKGPDTFPGSLGGFRQAFMMMSGYCGLTMQPIVRSLHSTFI